MQIKQADWNSWRTNSVTLEVFKVLRERKDIIAHTLAQGGACSFEEYAVAVGRYQEIDDLLGMTFYDMKEAE